MTRNIQVKKNLGLSQKLAEYIAKNPKSVKGLPENSSFIVFSSTDKSLNKSNKGLVKSVLAEGKSVIKAIQTHDKLNPWKFSAISY